MATHLQVVTKDNPVSVPKYEDLLARVRIALESTIEIAVPVEDIRRYENQPRKYFNQDSLDRLAQSIRSGGQTTSGMVREKPANTKYELIDGERRWRAISSIEIPNRPLYKAKLIEADDDVVQYLISGIANFNREGHTGLEVCDTIDRLLGFGLPMTEIAGLIGMSEMWAYQMHGLKNLSPEVRMLLDPQLPKAQQLPVSAAIQISKIEKPFQFPLALRVLSKEISLGRLRGEVIKVAKNTNTKIRLREVSSRHQWDSFQKKAGIAARAVTDSTDLLSKGEIGRYIKSNPKVSLDLVEQLRNVRKDIERIEQVILNSMK